MLHSPLALFHISTAVIAMFAGGLSMLFRKGSDLHRLAGNIFFVAMLGMAGAGTVLAVFFKPNIGNVMGGMLTIYLVSTAWVAAKRRARRTGAFDVAALVVVLALGTLDATLGIAAARSPQGLIQGYPPGLYFTFGAIAFLFASTDIRVLVRGGVEGAQRIRRHLWRMGLAFLMALFSFYPARAHLFSKAVNDSRLLYVPHVLLIGAMVFWMVRLRARRSVPKKYNVSLAFTPHLRPDPGSRR